MCVFMCPRFNGDLENVSGGETSIFAETAAVKERRGVELEEETREEETREEETREEETREEETREEDGE